VVVVVLGGVVVVVVVVAGGGDGTVGGVAMATGGVDGGVVDAVGVATGDVVGGVVDVAVGDDVPCDAVPAGVEAPAAIWAEREPVAALDADVAAAPLDCLLEWPETEVVVELWVPGILEAIVPGVAAAPPSAVISLLVA